MEIEQLANSAATTGSASSAVTGLADNFDTFLTLLTTQLQNQDPLEPLDSNEFTKQLVDFTNVEQNIRANDNLEAVLDLLHAAESASAVNYLGKFVEVEGSAAELKDGEALWSYALDNNAASTKLTITDEAGKLVFNAVGKTEAGSHDFVWNGTDNTSNPLPDGSYTLGVHAFDGDGDPIESTITTFGLVDGIETLDGRPILLVGGGQVPLEKVKLVKNAPPPDGQSL